MQRLRYTPEEEQLLMTQLWSPQIADNPETFVLFAFPWGQVNTPLERFKGPRKWQREVLREIADGVDAIDPASSDTVNRDKLRIDTRKWLMSAHNRKRYGEVKQVEVAGSISIAEALQQAQARVIEAEVIDVEPKQLENHDE